MDVGGKPGKRPVLQLTIVCIPELMIWNILLPARLSYNIALREDVALHTSPRPRTPSSASRSTPTPTVCTSRYGSQACTRPPGTLSHGSTCEPRARASTGTRAWRCAAVWVLKGDGIHKGPRAFWGKLWEFVRDRSGRGRVWLGD